MYVRIARFEGGERNRDERSAGLLILQTGPTLACAR